MKKQLLFLSGIILMVNGLCAQDNPSEPKFGLRFSGYIRTDLFMDTRQVVSTREGHFLLYPENVLPDQDGKDINKGLNFNMLSINTRLRGTVTGPEAFGAKTSGAIEGEFYGVADPDINGFRLRHAFVKLNWPKTELLIGQFWHPAFVVNCFPGAASYNTGAPFQPFNRSPQIRLTRLAGDFSFMLAAVTERDFASMGPTAGDPSRSLTGPAFMRNSGIPEGHFQVRYNPGKGEHLFGLGIGWKSLVPELYTVNASNTRKYKTHERISSPYALAFAKVVMQPVTMKLYGVLAQNATDLTMLGGYAVKEISDTATGKKTFAGLTTASAWFDVQTNGKAFTAGLFLAWCKNLGSSGEIYTNYYYIRGKNLGYMYRVAPRVMVTSGKVDIALEAEYTVAAYGTTGLKGTVTDTKEVANTRALVCVFYNF